MKKKMIVLIAFIYIASMLFCGDGVGKKFVEEKFPHLTYSDKECDDSKKKVEAAVAANDKAAAEAALKDATSAIASAGSKGIFHKNNAARKVSRLTKLVNGLA